MTLPHLIKPSEIQNELDRLEEAHKENQQQRACLFNVVVYAFQNERLPYFSKLIDQITQQFPCRVLFIQESDQANNKELKTHISVKILEEGHDKAIICEQITIEVPSALNQQVYPLILPHLVPDLPIHLIWAKDPTQFHPLFEKFAKLAHRIIFESKCNDDLHHFAGEVQNQLLKGFWDVADLNWIRLESWRKVIKSLFNSEEQLNELKDCLRIQLVYKEDANEYFCHNHFQVHYLHAWLAAQLDWVPDSFAKEKESKQILYKKPKGTCLVEITREQKQSDAVAGDITYLEILTPSKNKYTCILHPLESLIEVKISNEEKPKEIYNSFLMQMTWKRSLAKEICYQKTSQHYINMLGVLASIKGLT